MWLFINCPVTTIKVSRNHPRESLILTEQLTYLLPSPA